MAVRNGRWSTKSTTTYQLLVDGASLVTLGCLGPVPAEIVATATNVAPATTVSGHQMLPGEKWVGQALTDLFPGVSGPLFLWFRAESDFGTTISVSHA